MCRDYPVPVPGANRCLESPDLSRDDRYEPEDTSVQAGRITGTVIDRTSVTQATGIIIRVDKATVLTDANGNNDRAGLLNEALALAERLDDRQWLAAVFDERRLARAAAGERWHTLRLLDQVAGSQPSPVILRLPISGSPGASKSWRRMQRLKEALQEPEGLAAI
jgi:hypothetical protein